jgi:hypothetical protein
MNIDDQKFMALEGLHTWAGGVIERATHLNDLQSRFAGADVRSNLTTVRRSFQRERYFFLTAANQLCAHINWANRLNFLEPDIFTELGAFQADIKALRDLNEHVIEYFEGGGQKPQEWWRETDRGKADASATVGQRIGDRLDWNELADAARRLVLKLPPMYIPKVPAP